MLKIFNTQQIRELDKYTIQHEPIASIDLMERACRAFFKWYTIRFDASQKVGIVCGTGNNGGDGLGIARLLKEKEYDVRVWIVRDTSKESPDFTSNMARLKGKVSIEEFPTNGQSHKVSSVDILIDAIFGSGLSKPVSGIYGMAIEVMNRTKATRISVDIPSGLSADGPSSGSIVRAHHTVTFQLPKLAFLLPENEMYVGRWHIVNIGLSLDFIKKEKTKFDFVTRRSVRSFLRPRPFFSHKGQYGRALLISGSLGKMGACVLAARAAMRSGLGLLTVHVPESGRIIIQTAVPEAMASVDKENDVVSSPPSLEGIDVIGIGPGIGTSSAAALCLQKTLESRKPMVIDADALNILGTHPAMMALVPVESILTPHPKEFERLVGPWTDDFHKLEKLRELAIKLKSVVVLKGAYTAIAVPEGNVHFNSTGNPGMATGGSGDVLTGILTGLRAQGIPADEAAILGVYLHGLAGDLAANDKGTYSLIASDLVDYLSSSFTSVR